jgi:restriction system protein
MDKRSALLALARKRQATRWDIHKGSGKYKGIGDREYADGSYECDYVSPYTKTAGNVDAEVFVMLQDWSPDEGLKGPRDQDSVDSGSCVRCPVA